MSNKADGFLEMQDEAISHLFLENNADQLTDILVQALEDAFELLAEEAWPVKTVH
jgi:hypothetical protein